MIEKRRPGRPRKETASVKETALIKETAQGKETASDSHRYGPKKERQSMINLTPQRKRRVGNPALTGDAITATPAENANYIMQGLKILNMPNIDLHDPVQVQNRIDEYMRIIAENGNKPTVAGLGLALNGMDRNTLYQIAKENYRRGEVPYHLPPEVSTIIKKTYKFMEVLWENYMLNGKINPVSGIFLGKNHYNYQDKTEYVLTPNQQGAGDLSEKQLLDRYGIDSQDGSDSVIDSEA